jgi:hypothetical protein
MGVHEKLRELEEPPPGCELVDIEMLMRDVPGCDCQVNEMQDTIVFYHVGWGHLLTFSRSKRYVPQSRLREVIDLVRSVLPKEANDH